MVTYHQMETTSENAEQNQLVGLENHLFASVSILMEDGEMVYKLLYNFLIT